MKLFEFLSAVKDQYAEAVMPVCKKHGLTYMEFNVLLFLANNPAYTTAAEIVEQRRLTKSHVSISVRSLTERGLLRGEYREGNRRTVHLLLCGSAEAIVRDGRAAQEAFTDALYRGFSEHERAQMQGYMDRIGENVTGGAGAKEQKA